MEQDNTTNSSNSSTKMSPIAIGLVIVVLLAVGGYALTSGKAGSLTNTEDTSETMMEEEDDSMMEESDSMMEEGETKVFEVEGGSFYYKPNIIRVKKGDTVKVNLTSVDMMHDFVIDELNIRTEILKSGSTGSVEFTADEVGEYEFYCSVGNHRAQGMKGTLIVEE